MNNRTFFPFHQVKYMKALVLLFLAALHIPGSAQHVVEINLSKTLDETRMGHWTTGDYTVYIELGALETSFRNTYSNYLAASKNLSMEDSVTYTLNTLAAKRYLAAADQLQAADQAQTPLPLRGISPGMGEGFDLRKLIIYYGPENDTANSGSSPIVESYVRQLVESGTAAVVYKGKRIFTLKNLQESEGIGLDFGYNVKVYFNDPENCLFKYYRHLGW